ncbi:MAG: helix-turn-helix domain-containing protein [Oscillospiraceae bacterium]|nr:helix-turn-helix domain-containing protein [Oscillospiraceae bacterium]
MNTYVTGTTIRKLREGRGLTQAELAERIGVSSKTVSKWETARGLPDISLLQPLAKALGISVVELMNGEQIVNRNVSANLLRSKFHVCPLCGNVLHSFGSALVNCCGITLPALEAEEADNDHTVTIEKVEDEQFLTIRHPMTKEHYISFLAFVTADRVQLVKLYPEGDAQTRLQLRGLGRLYWYCNRHGLFWKKP